MDFELSETAAAVQKGMRELCANFGTDYWSRCDAQERWPEELWTELGRGGWLGLAVPEAYGGGGLGLFELAVAMEELAASGAGTAGAFLYLLTPGFGGVTISRHGTDEQKRDLLPGIAAGTTQTCFALTEPDAGSNALAISTTARRDGDDLVLRGQKIWISGVQRADWMLVVCRTTPAAEASGRTSGFSVLLVDVKEAEAAGTLQYTPIHKAGNRIVKSNQVHFDDVRVPTDRVLGEIDAGFAVLWDILNPERVLAAAGGVGTAELALRLAVDYARTREVFGRPIGANQGLAFPLARVKAQAELARLMTHKAAWLYDHGRPSGDEANIAKLTAAGAAWDAADRAYQTYGGMAFSEEYPIARLHRDARIAKNIPVAEELVLAHIATQGLGLPRSY
ncbi:MAG: acyl-CoA/acyl-ACP dehydrogenase [Pseudonocardia sp.]|nr:acyl-CoA/acyl-ACP dehydrogenase [Pseudonocardia sp.]